MPGSHRTSPIVAVLLLVLLSACAAQDQPAGVDSETKAYLNDAVAAYESRLPLRIHENGELVALETYDNVLAFTFSFSNLDEAGDKDLPLMKKIMTSVIGIVGCKNPQITEWLAKGVVFRYRFLDEAGNTFAEQDLEEATCAS